ncbi:MAG: transposase [Ruminococcus sp.]
MAFRTNSYQQLSFADSFEGLTFREQKALEHSWAKVFAEDIFPAINEEPFRVLYSSNASRPNTPVNVCIGALIIKELFGISDDEVVENLMLDPRYQYALHTSSFEEQPLSDKTLTRFRKRCYDYESIHGIDLLHECMTGLGTNIAKLMDISPRVKRMDSMMIAANIRKLSRIELLYTCVKKLVIYFHKNSRDELIKGMEHYCDPNDYNKTFYYSNDSDTENHLAAILKDADRLLDLVERIMMTSQNTSYWYAVFLNRPLWKKVSVVSALKKMAVSIQEYFKIHLTQMQHIEAKLEKNIRAMWQILKKPLIEMVLLSQITSLSKTFTVTAVF